jgi:hypothetical protein
MEVPENCAELETLPELLGEPEFVWRPDGVSEFTELPENSAETEELCEFTDVPEFIGVPEIVWAAEKVPMAV